MSKLSPANGHYREAWIRPPSTQRSGLADLNEQFTTASRPTEIKRCFAYSEESSRGGQIELYKGTMDAAPREPDDGRHGYHRGRSKRPLGCQPADDRSSTPGFGGVGGKGPWRCCSLQELASSDQPRYRRSRERGRRLARHWRRSG